MYCAPTSGCRLILILVDFLKMNSVLFCQFRACKRSEQYVPEIIYPSNSNIDNVGLRHPNFELYLTISKHFGVTYTNVFENYLDVVRCVRNTCAHGGLLYDMALYPLIRRGPANVLPNERNKMYGALKVVGYLLKQVSENRSADFENEVEILLKKYATSPAIKAVLREISGFPV